MRASPTKAFPSASQQAIKPPNPLQVFTYTHASNTPNEDTIVDAHVESVGRVVAVFDGNGGPSASVYLQNALADTVASVWSQQGASAAGTSPADDHDRLKQLYATLDGALLQRLGDKSLLKQQPTAYEAGASAVTAIISPDGGKLLVANIGDCRAVLGSMSDGQWQATRLSKAHSANCGEEVLRLQRENAGTKMNPVQPPADDEDNTCRVQGVPTGRNTRARTYTRKQTHTNKHAHIHTCTHTPAVLKASPLAVMHIL